MNDENNLNATLVEVAQLYYEKSLSQQEIANRLGVSRPLIALYVKKARERGIVRIEVRNPSLIRIDLAEQICQKYGVKRATVVPTSRTSLELTRLHLGKVAAQLLEGCLQDGDVIGLGWGRSIESVITQLESTSPRKLEVVPLMGENSNNDTFTQVNFLVKQVASNFGGKPFFLLAPMVSTTSQLRKAMTKDRTIRLAIDRWDHLSVACLGIGALPPAPGQVLYVDRATANSLLKAKAVGDMVARYFDINGCQIKNQLEDRMLGISFKQLKRVPRVLVVANGVEKSKALAGALHIGIITDLFVDEDLANATLQEWG